MIIKKETDIPSSEVTEKNLYLNRRQFMKTAAALAVAAAVPGDFVRRADAGRKLIITKQGEFAGGDRLTSFSKAAGYNNFYEFSIDKDDVAERSKKFRTRPWTVSVEGQINKPHVYGIDELINLFPLTYLPQFASIFHKNRQYFFRKPKDINL
jgi:sulfoxide reductase catalytic subunit YedY